MPIGANSEQIGELFEQRLTSLNTRSLLSVNYYSIMSSLLYWLNQLELRTAVADIIDYTFQQSIKKTNQTIYQLNFYL